MLKGFYLTLMIGPAVPVPAPQPVMDALASIQVNSDKDRSGFQLTFNVSKKSPLMTTMLPAGYFDPIITRVIIIATVSGMPSVLMDGIITRQELTPSDDPSKSTLTVTGEDLSVLMDIVQMPFMRFPAQPANVRVLTMLAKYVAFGVVCLLDSGRRPLLPRWLGYLSFWAAFTFFAVFFMPSFKSGPLSWQGLVTFYVALGAFFVWIAAVIPCSLNAITAIEREQSG